MVKKNRKAAAKKVVAKKAAAKPAKKVEKKVDAKTAVKVAEKKVASKKVAKAGPKKAVAKKVVAKKAAAKPAKKVEKKVEAKVGVKAAEKRVAPKKVAKAAAKKNVAKKAAAKPAKKVEKKVEAKAGIKAAEKKVAPKKVAKAAPKKAAVKKVVRKKAVAKPAKIVKISKLIKAATKKVAPKKVAKAAAKKVAKKKVAVKAVVASAPKSVSKSGQKAAKRKSFLKKATLGVTAAALLAGAGSQAKAGYATDMLSAGFDGAKSVIGGGVKAVGAVAALPGAIAVDVMKWANNHKKTAAAIVTIGVLGSTALAWYGFSNAGDFKEAAKGLAAKLTGGDAYALPAAKDGIKSFFGTGGTVPDHAQSFADSVYSLAGKGIIKGGDMLESMRQGVLGANASAADWWSKPGVIDAMRQGAAKHWGEFTEAAGKNWTNLKTATDTQWGNLTKAAGHAKDEAMRYGKDAVKATVKGAKAAKDFADEHTIISGAGAGVAVRESVDLLKQAAAARLRGTPGSSSKR